MSFDRCTPALRLGKFASAYGGAHKQAEAGPLDTPAVPAMAQALRMVERMAAQNSAARHRHGLQGA